MSNKKGNVWNMLHFFIVKKMGQARGMFYTEHKRPRKAVNYNTASNQLTEPVKTAIVLQGPLIAEDDFTLETIRIYKKNFKDSDIIVSTWATEDKDMVSKIEHEHVTVVLNEKPSYPGISNINYQVVSSINGIKKGKERGARYIIKSRTDQRIYSTNVMAYFLDLLKIFPLKNNSIQKERLIVPAMNTFLYRMYGISDMTMFGHIDDMIMYWDAPLDDRIAVPRPVKQSTVREYAQLRTAEIYLCTEFLKKIGRDIKWTIEDSWNVFGSNFCIIDNASIDIYWPKYYRYAEFRNVYYDSYHTHQLVNFKDWLSIYNNKNQLPDETILENGEGNAFS